jgi:hypothetical protein
LCLLSAGKELKNHCKKNEQVDYLLSTTRIIAISKTMYKNGVMDLSASVIEIAFNLVVVSRLD